jgi:lipid-A-disaccharide synthase
MPTPREKYRIFVSAAEPSADVHCANLIRAFRARHPDAAFFGVGGPKMAAAGCRLLEDTTHRAAMAHDAFKEVAHYWRLLRRVKRSFQTERPDLVIVCDSPSFNFHVAKAAKKVGLRTMFYVAPQLWAWGAWRINKLRRHCDRLCCILPFEEQWFRDRGIDAVFVGNPLLDALEQDLTQNAKAFADLGTRPLTIAIMPGSRTAEIQTLWKPMQQIAMRLLRTHPGTRFVTVAVNVMRRHQLEGLQEPGFECEYAVDSVYRTATAADFALVASGSATLEVAAAGCPMVVMYQTSPLLWHLLGRWLVRPRFFSLVNLISDRDLVTEFMPYFASVEPIVARTEDLLADRPALERLSQALVATAASLANKNASIEVASIAWEMIDGNRSKT